MPKIKCPACWNDIPSESENCPCCGFVLKTSQNVNKDGLTQSDYNKLKVDSATKYPSTPYNTPNTVIEREKKNKAIISIAVALIVIIVIVGVSNSNKGKREHDRSYYKDFSQSDYSDYYGGTSYPKTGNEGALYKAKSYLNSSAFSYTGLIEQLEYEGFSTSEATYGADNCGANWKEQALKKARSYLESSAFSESGLQEQLEYEGFSEDEASYAVTNCNADWKQQAVKKAASYLRSHSNWTRSELIEQLEYEGFSYDQATYGASQNGL